MSDHPVAPSKPSLADKIETEKAHPLPWKTVAKRAVVVAEEAELRIRAPQSFLKELAQGHRDPRLPAVGTCLNREFQGRTISVEVLEKGFCYQEKIYRSLSAVARQVTGVQWNGFAFFALPVNVGRRT